MSIELRNETLLTLNQAARMLPSSRRGRPVHLSCIYRWILDGVKTPHGKVRLEAIRLGGRWLTSVEALERLPHVRGGEPPGELLAAVRTASSPRAWG